MWLSRLSNRSPFLSFARSPTRFRCVCTSGPVLRPGRVSLSGFPVGRAPSLHRLLGRYPRVRRLLRYYERVRLLEGVLAQIVARCLPALACSSTIDAGPLRGLPVPVQQADAGVPSSSTPGGVPPLRPSCFEDAPWPSAVVESVGSAKVLFRGSITRPAHSPPYASPSGSPSARARSASQGEGSSRGRTWVHLSFPHLLPVAGFTGATHDAKAPPEFGGCKFGHREVAGNPQMPSDSVLAPWRRGVVAT